MPYVLALFSAVTSSFGLPAMEPVRTFVIDTDHSTVAFSVAIAGGLTDVGGRFEEFAGRIEYDPDEPSRSSVRVTIQAASVDTGNDRRDRHLRSEDFFDVATHPTLTFESDRVEATAEGFRMTGRLTIRGTTRRVTIPFVRTHEAPVLVIDGIPTVAFHGTTEIDRTEFSVKANARWNRLIPATGELAMSDRVRITLDVIAEERGAR